VHSALANKQPLEAEDEGQPLDLTEVYRQYVQTVARWAARLGGPGMDVEDVVQDVFLSVQRALPHFRGESRLGTWLYRITENTVTQRRRRWRWTRWLGGTGEEVARDVASGTASPEQAFESREATARVYRALERMKDRSRNLIVLFELEGMSGEAIAELTGTKTATVWVQLHRARVEFLKQLQALDKGEYDA
jgi:RNA polymerase sigma-70 factor (ECF subfamily)